MHDPGLYSRSFLDVYDQWYGDLGDAEVVASALLERCGAGALVVELGSGTGRLTAPVQRAGMQSIGLDISSEMLLGAPATSDRVAADMAEIPLADGSANAVLIAYNTLFNLSTAESQARCLRESARVLRPSGVLAIEAFIAPHTEASTSRFGVSTVPHPTEAGASVVIVTERADAGDLITGTHIEVLGHRTTCRPWRLRYLSPRELDVEATQAGLHLAHRSNDWDGGAFEPDGTRHVSWYERA